MGVTQIGGAAGGFTVAATFAQESGGARGRFQLSEIVGDSEVAEDEASNSCAGLAENDSADRRRIVSLPFGRVPDERIKTGLDASVSSDVLAVCVVGFDCNKGNVRNPASMS